MKVVIPVAGKGTRLYPITHTTPKPLVPVAGKPVLGHILERVEGLGAQEIVLVVNPGTGEEIVRYASGVVSAPVRHAEQPEPLGLGHAVYQAAPFEGPILIILGDTIIDAPLKDWLSEDFIAVKRVEDPRRFGVVGLEGERVAWAVEKPDEPPSNLAIVGVYYITDGRRLQRALEEVINRGIKTKGEFQLTDALNLMLKEGWRPWAREIEEWHDCGKIDALLESNRRLLEKAGRENAVSPEAKVVSSRVGPWVTVSEGAVLEDSVVQNSIIMEGAFVKDSVIKNSVIGKHAVVKGFTGSLVIGDHSKVEER